MTPLHGIIQAVVKNFYRCVFLFRHACTQRRTASAVRCGGIRSGATVRSSREKLESK